MAKPSSPDPGSISKERNAARVLKTTRCLCVQNELSASHDQRRGEVIPQVAASHNIQNKTQREASPENKTYLVLCTVPEHQDSCCLCSAPSVGLVLCLLAREGLTASKMGTEESLSLSCLTLASQQCCLPSFA